MMDMSLEAREKLASIDDTFAQMHQEHQVLEERLAVLQGKFGPTVEEELEEKRLKKQKLILKDRMGQYLREMEMSASS